MASQGMSRAGLEKGPRLRMQNKDEEKEAGFLFEKKLALFYRYLSATEKIKQALGDKQESIIERLISKRQGLIHEIDKIDMSIKQILPARPDKPNLISTTFKESIADYLKKIKPIMEMIETMDRELTVVFRQEGASIKTALLKKQKVKQAAKGYGGFHNYPAKFLDTRR